MGSAASIERGGDTASVVDQFQTAIYKAAGVKEEGVVCNDDVYMMPSPANSASSATEKLRVFFESADLNKDGVIDADEFDKMLKRIHMHLPPEIATKLFANMKELFLKLDEVTCDVALSMFTNIKNASESAQRRKIVSRDIKRVVFVGGTGAGKSALCTALTGHDKKSTPFEIGNRCSSHTVVCNRLTFHWFGDPGEEEFVCIDTPGLNDELGRDDAHVNSIIEELRSLEYVNAIVFVANGQDNRFSLALQKMIKRFEEAFSKRFYQYSMICLTRWYMDPPSIEEREDDGRTEKSVQDELNAKISKSPQLCCEERLPVVFVDSQYKARDPTNGKRRLQRIQEHVGEEVFRTAELNKIKPKISDLTNTNQEFRKDASIASMSPILFDSELVIDRWYVEPALPDGLTVSEGKGIISGAPRVVCAERKFHMFASSLGGVSDGLPFTIEVSHSKEDIALIVKKALIDLSERLDVLLPLDEKEIPSDEEGARIVIEEAKVVGNEHLLHAIDQLALEHGKIRTFPAIVDNLRASYENLFLYAENLFLTANQQAISHGREQDQAENKLNIALLELTENASNLKRNIDLAIGLGCNPDVIAKAQHWLAEITTAPCCNHGHGCILHVKKKDLVVHELTCVFGLPLRSKAAVVRKKPELGADAFADKVVLSPLGGGEKSSFCGKYVLEGGEFFLINRPMRRLQYLRPQEKGRAVGARYKTSHHSHDLTRSGGARLAGEQCDVCGARRPAYTCLPCDFDLCEGCYSTGSR